MITCSDTRRLFDRYLDDQLSPSLQAELHAHVVHCSDCQNELAILEACGDVVRLDRREPVLSVSFTDRVMAARRAQVVAKAPRSRRLVYAVGMPMAAAASVVLAFLLSIQGVTDQPLQSGDTLVAVVDTAATAPPPETAVAAITVAAPVQFQQELTKLTAKKLAPEAQEELRNTPEMPALSFFDALLAPVMEGTRHAVEGTRRTAADLELLIRFGLASMNEQLVAEYRLKYPDEPWNAKSGGPRVVSDLDPLDPALLAPDFYGSELSSPVPAADSRSDDLAVAPI
ncbi:MAG: hypothetical protein GXY55_15965 [Phycisphaerae bacterium]|nr:hypothetical protein [Phycisphaerae bacterium]